MKFQEHYSETCRDVRICVIPPSLLSGLLAICAENAVSGLERIYVEPRENLFVAMNPQVMLWVRARMEAGRNAFTVSANLCAQALKAAVARRTEIAI